MAAKYVNITRQEFEDWLFDLCPVFERVDDTQGIYLVPVSSVVAIKISTTLSLTGRTTRRGEGRCRMRFVNRHGARPLYRSGEDRRDANRTQGWKRTWGRHLQEMLDTFKSHRQAYTKLALKTQPEYAAEWQERIEAYKNWEHNDFLVSIHGQLTEGRWLTSKQEAAVWRVLRPRPRRKKTAKRAGSSRTRTRLTDEHKRLLVAVDRLLVCAQEADDQWLIDFCDSLTKRLKGARDLTTRQRETLDKNLKTHNVKIPAAA